jgi:hypothetical protein
MASIMILVTFEEKCIRRVASAIAPLKRKENIKGKKIEYINIIQQCDSLLGIDGRCRKENIESKGQYTMAKSRKM